MNGELCKEMIALLCQKHLPYQVLLACPSHFFERWNAWLPELESHCPEYVSLLQTLLEEVISTSQVEV